MSTASQLRAQIAALKAERQAIVLPPPGAATRDARNRESKRKRTLKGRILSLEAQLALLTERVAPDDGPPVDDGTVDDLTRRLGDLAMDDVRAAQRRFADLAERTAGASDLGDAALGRLARALDAEARADRSIAVTAPVAERERLLKFAAELETRATAVRRKLADRGTSDPNAAARFSRQLATLVDGPVRGLTDAELGERETEAQELLADAQREADIAAIQQVLERVRAEQSNRQRAVARDRENAVLAATRGLEQAVLRATADSRLAQLREQAAGLVAETYEIENLPSAKLMNKQRAALDALMTAIDQRRADLARRAQDEAGRAAEAARSQQEAEQRYAALLARQTQAASLDIAALEQLQRDLADEVTQDRELAAAAATDSVARELRQLADTLDSSAQQVVRELATRAERAADAQRAEAAADAERARLAREKVERAQAAELQRQQEAAEREARAARQEVQEDAQELLLSAPLAAGHWLGDDDRVVERTAEQIGVALAGANQTRTAHQVAFVERGSLYFHVDGARLVRLVEALLGPYLDANYRQVLDTAAQKKLWLDTIEPLLSRIVGAVEARRRAGDRETAVDAASEFLQSVATWLFVKLLTGREAYDADRDQYRAQANDEINNKIKGWLVGSESTRQQLLFGRVEEFYDSAHGRQARDPKTAANQLNYRAYGAAKTKDIKTNTAAKQYPPLLDALSAGMSQDAIERAFMLDIFRHYDADAFRLAFDRRWQTANGIFDAITSDFVDDATDPVAYTTKAKTASVHKAVELLQTEDEVSVLNKPELDNAAPVRVIGSLATEFANVARAMIGEPRAIGIVRTQLAALAAIAVFPDIAFQPAGFFGTLQKKSYIARYGRRPRFEPAAGTLAPEDATVKTASRASAAAAKGAFPAELRLPTAADGALVQEGAVFDALRPRLSTQIRKGKDAPKYTRWLAAAQLLDINSMTTLQKIDAAGGKELPVTVLVPTNDAWTSYVSPSDEDMRRRTAAYAAIVGALDLERLADVYDTYTTLDGDSINVRGMGRDASGRALIEINESGPIAVLTAASGAGRFERRARGGSRFYVIRGVALPPSAEFRNALKQAPTPDARRADTTPLVSVVTDVDGDGDADAQVRQGNTVDQYAPLPADAGRRPGQLPPPLPTVRAAADVFFVADDGLDTDSSSSSESAGEAANPLRRDSFTDSSSSDSDIPRDPARSREMRNLEALLERAGLVAALRQAAQTQPLTVFAPTGAAQLAAGGLLNALSGAQLAEAVKYHVVPGRKIDQFAVNNAAEAGRSWPTLAGAELAARLGQGAERGALYVGDLAAQPAEYFDASRQVLVVFIDRVLLAPLAAGPACAGARQTTQSGVLTRSQRAAASPAEDALLEQPARRSGRDRNRGALEALMRATGLAPTLLAEARAGPLTVFVPTLVAQRAARIGSLARADLIDAVKFHVVRGEYSADEVAALAARRDASLATLADHNELLQVRTGAGPPTAGVLYVASIVASASSLFEPAAAAARAGRRSITLHYIDTVLSADPQATLEARVNNASTVCGDDDDTSTTEDYAPRDPAPPAAPSYMVGFFDLAPFKAINRLFTNARAADDCAAPLAELGTALRAAPAAKRGALARDAKNALLLNTKLAAQHKRPVLEKLAALATH